MKILVTGGAGFIGSHLVDALIKQRHRVIIIDNLSTGRQKNINQKAKFYKIDILSPKIKNVFQKEKPEIIFHLAAHVDLRKSTKDPIFDAKNNIIASLNILNQASENKARMIFFPSTAGIYGQVKKVPISEKTTPSPISPYTLTKLTIEHYLKIYYQNFGLPYTILRLSNVYGPRQNAQAEAGVITIFINRLLRHQVPIIYGSGQQTRDFVYIDDAINAFLLALKFRKVNFYNVGSGLEISINQLFQKIKKIIGSTIQPKYLPSIKGEVLRNTLSYQKIKKEFGWQPKINLDEGLRKTVNWLKNEIN